MDIFRPILIVPAGLILLNVVAFLLAREGAQRSAAARGRIIRWSILAIVAGLVVAFGAWKVMSTNRESPGMIFTYLVSWLGGAAVILALLILIAALTARPTPGGVE